MIRDAINRRYDMIHYLYTTFYQATITGLPLMRNMFMEYPDEQALWTSSNQFMLGDKMLVAPKLKTPSEELEKAQRQAVQYMLPTSDIWYNYYSKKLESTAKDAWTYTNLPDLEQAVFIKGGSVLPILGHEGCMALTKCINNTISLEVYLDSEGKATGEIYTDDGVSYNTKMSKDYALTGFLWEKSSLISWIMSDTEYAFPAT